MVFMDVNSVVKCHDYLLTYLLISVFIELRSCVNVDIAVLGSQSLRLFQIERASVPGSLKTEVKSVKQSFNERAS